MTEPRTLFKGVVEDISQVIGYMGLANYYHDHHIALNFSSQGGDLNILIERETIKDSNGIERHIGKFRLESAYFNDPKKEFSAEELDNNFIYTQLQEIFSKRPVTVKGISEPTIGLVVIPLNGLSYDKFVMDLCAKIDHDTRDVQLLGRDERKGFSLDEIDK